MKRRFVPQLRIKWTGVVANCADRGPPGFSYYSGTNRRRPHGPTELLEFRDRAGVLRGVLILYGRTKPGARRQLLVLVDPECRGQKGICTALIAEAERRRFEIDWNKQEFTRAGWKLRCSGS